MQAEAKAMKILSQQRYFFMNMNPVKRAILLPAQLLLSTGHQV